VSGPVEVISFQFPVISYQLSATSNQEPSVLFLCVALPTLCSLLPPCHPERSDPIFSSAPAFPDVCHPDRRPAPFAGRSGGIVPQSRHPAIILCASPRNPSFRAKSAKREIPPPLLYVRHLPQPGREGGPLVSLQRPLSACPPQEGSGRLSLSDPHLTNHPPAIPPVAQGESASPAAFLPGSPGSLLGFFCLCRGRLLRRSALGYVVADLQVGSRGFLFVTTRGPCSAGRFREFCGFSPAVPTLTYSPASNTRLEGALSISGTTL